MSNIGYGLNNFGKYLFHKMTKFSPTTLKRRGIAELHNTNVQTEMIDFKVFITKTEQICNEIKWSLKYFFLRGSVIPGIKILQSYVYRSKSKIKYRDLNYNTYLQKNKKTTR
jgi:hypothetical protein